jgi:uncharacterized membrane protein YqhA
MTEFVRRMLGGSRYIVLLAVLGSFISAAMLTLYGLVAVAAVTVRSFTEMDWRELNQRAVEHFALELIALIDMFLLGTVLYIVALGLYELFIDSNLPLPPWLLIEDLDDLKEKLGGVVIVLIGVTFLGDFVESDGGIGILWLGLGGAAIIVAIAVAFAVRPRHGPGHVDRGAGPNLSLGGPRRTPAPDPPHPTPAVEPNHGPAEMTPR